MSRFSILLTILLIINFSHSYEKRFEIINKTITWPSIQFYGNAGEDIQIKFQLISPLGVEFGFRICKIDSEDDFFNASFTGCLDYTTRNTPIYTYKPNLPTNNSYVLFFQLIQPSEILFLKIELARAGTIIKTLYETTTKSSFKYAIYQFTTTSNCKIKSYWSGPPTGIDVYEPGSNIFTQPPLFFIPPENSTFQLQVDKNGTWNLVIKQYLTQWRKTTRGILQLKTFSENPCTNYCSEKAYPVVGLSPWSSSICRCDQSVVPLLWDQENLLCKSPICNNNNIVEDYQLCDNGGQKGCSAFCVPDIDYNCSRNLNQGSVCVNSSSSQKQSQCANGIRQKGEQCDNGGKKGCSSSCIPDVGYYCTGNEGEVSTCFTLFIDKIFCYFVCLFGIFVILASN